MKLEPAWIVWWSAWVLAGVIAEFIALYRKAKGDTLSEQVWFVLAIPGWGPFLGWMLGAFLLWLIFHFLGWV